MKQILIVDDSASVRSSLRFLLDGRAQLSVCGVAVDGQDAIEKAKQLDPDVIVLDLAMPRMNGAEAAAVLRTTNPRACIILLTLYADSVGHNLAAAAGVDMIFSKRDDIANLVECIESLPERNVPN